MSLKRFYYKKVIGVGRLRAVRDVLATSFNWGIETASYHLYFPAEEVSLNTVDGVERCVKERGEEPQGFIVRYRTTGGSSLTLDTIGSDRIIIEANPSIDNPSVILDTVEAILDLTLISAVPTGPKLQSAFIAHSFDDNGRTCANELGRFLELLGLIVHTGRGYAPKSISEKVQGRLAEYDIVFTVVTPQYDATWLTQETAWAKAIGKPVFVLKQDNAEFKPGILGDLEYIPFPESQITRTFTPILEGLKELREGASNCGRKGD